MTAVVHTKVLHLTPKAVEAIDAIRDDLGYACPVISVSKTAATFLGKPAEVADAIEAVRTHGVGHHSPSGRTLARVAVKLRAYAGASDRHVQVTAYSTGPAVPAPLHQPFYED